MTGTTTKTRHCRKRRRVLIPLVERLRVGQKLLSVAWVRAKKTTFGLYPEVLMIDDTYGTNSEGLPLGIIACFYPDMRSFTPLRTFLCLRNVVGCSDGIWETAIPTLLGRKYLTRILLLRTDGDSKMYELVSTQQ